MVVLATRFDTLGVDLRMRTKRLGTKGEGEKKEVRCEILAYQEKSGLPENYMRTGERNLLRTGSVQARMKRTSSLHCACRKAAVEETDGGSSRQEGLGVALSVLGGEQLGK